MFHLFPCVVSYKQRIESHLHLVHGKGKPFLIKVIFLYSVFFREEIKSNNSFCKSTGPFKRKYKIYIEDSSVAIPRTTQYNHKRKCGPPCVRIENEPGTSVTASNRDLFSSVSSEVCLSNTTQTVTRYPNLQVGGPLCNTFPVENDAAVSHDLCYTRVV